MKTNEAKILLQKYFEGETSPAEEKALAGFFSQDDIPFEMQPYRKWFAGIDELAATPDTDSFEEKAMQFIQEQEFHRKRKMRSLRYTLSGIAASLIIVAGSLTWYFQQPAYTDTFSDQAEAVAYAEKTLAFVSSEYNKGLARLNPIGNLEKGTRPVGKSMKIINKGFDEVKKIHFLNNE